MIAEYQQTKIRYEKLKDLNNRIEAAESSYGQIKPPKFNSPIYLLRDQQEAMGRYLHILEVRAIHEGVDLGKEVFVNEACCGYAHKVFPGAQSCASC